MKRARLSIARARDAEFGTGEVGGGNSRGTQTDFVTSSLREFVLDIWQQKKISDQDVCLLSHYATESGFPECQISSKNTFQDHTVWGSVWS
jgi:hypothetical protein